MHSILKWYASNIEKSFSFLRSTFMFNANFVNLFIESKVPLIYSQPKHILMTMNIIILDKMELVFVNLKSFMCLGMNTYLYVMTQKNLNFIRLCSFWDDDDDCRIWWRHFFMSRKMCSWCRFCIFIQCFWYQTSVWRLNKMFSFSYSNLYIDKRLN